MNQTRIALPLLLVCTLLPATPTIAGEGVVVVSKSTNAVANPVAPATPKPAMATSPHLLRLEKVAISAFSPDGKVLMTTGEEDKQVHFWSVQDGQEVNRFGVGVTNAIFSANGARVMTWGDDGVTRIFDAHSGKALRRLEGAGAPLRAATISPDGSRALTCAVGEKVIKIWDTSRGQLLGTLDGNTSPVTGLAFSPDGTQAVSLAGEAVAAPQEMTSPSPFLPGKQHVSTPLPRAAIGPNVPPISPPVPTVAPTVPATAPSAAATAPALAPPGFILVHWDLQTRKPLRKIELPGAAQWPFFSDKGKLVLMLINNAARIFDLSTGQEVQAGHAPGENFPAGQLTPDRKTGLTKTIGSASIVNAQSGEVIRALEGPIDGLPICNHFSADASRVIIGTGKVAIFSRSPNEPGKVYVHDVATGKRLATFEGHAREVTQVSLSHDATHAFSRDANKVLFLWTIK